MEAENSSRVVSGGIYNANYAINYRSDYYYPTLGREYIWVRIALYVR